MIYNELIIANWKNPANFFRPKDFDFYGCEHNVLCGDSIEIFIKIFGGKARVSFSGKGCVLSIACASILTQMLNGSDLNKIKGVDEKAFFDFLGFEVFGIRRGCALLALSALKKAFK
jgi:nitrogen fixation NifU-like protein